MWTIRWSSRCSWECSPSSADGAGIADFLARRFSSVSTASAQHRWLVSRALSHPIQSREFLPQIWEFGHLLARTHRPTLLVGVALLALLVALKRVAPKVPAPLAGVIAGGLAVFVFDLGARGVAMVGEVASGLPPLAVPSIDPNDVRALAGGALGIALVSYCSAMLTARSFAAKNRYEIDANQDFIALGVANLAAGLSRSSSAAPTPHCRERRGRRGVQASPGRRGPPPAVASSCSRPPIAYVPGAALAVLIMAGIGLIDIATLATLRRFEPFEFRLSIATTIGVLLAGVLPGILIAVTLAIVKLLAYASRPNDAILGEIPGQDSYHDIAGHADARTVPGLIIYRFDAALLFVNANRFKQRIREVVAAAPAPPRWLIFSAEAANLLDFTGAEAIEQIRGELAAQGTTFAIARSRGLFALGLHRSGLADRIGADHLFPSVSSGVEAFLEHDRLRAASPHAVTRSEILEAGRAARTIRDGVFGSEAGLRIAAVLDWENLDQIHRIWCEMNSGGTDDRCKDVRSGDHADRPDGRRRCASDEDGAGDDGNADGHGRFDREVDPDRDDQEAGRHLRRLHGAL
jgi:hypothetical protein